VISLHEPRFSEEDERLVLETLRSTWVSTGGPYVDEFEKTVADFVGAKHAVSVVNGTVALQLALEVLKRKNNIRSNFDVIVPSLSFIATSNAVFHAGGNPVLVDCAPGSMNIAPDQVLSIIESFYRRDSAGHLISKKTGNVLLCIMPAHIMGWSCDMMRLSEIAGAFKLPVIDDAAEALGARYLDKSHVGSTSLAAAYSFNGNKILTTGGGGMLVTDDQEFAALAKHLSTTAKTDGLRYIHDQVGYNFRMVNILAALGVSQLRRLGDTLGKKRVIFDEYFEASRGHNYKIHRENFSVPNHWIINVVFPTEAHREKALKNLLEKKIQARPLWTPAHRLDFIGYQSRLTHDFPNADDIWRTALSLPSSPHLSTDEISMIVSAIREVL
jgi:perosamine synthetase